MKNITIFLVIILSFFCVNVVGSSLQQEFLILDEYLSLRDALVVSASRREQKLSDAPLSITVITAEDIKNSGVQSIAESLRMVPGVLVQETTSGQQDVSIRGLSNFPKEAGAFSAYARNILVMINGSSFFNDVFGGTYWELLPITLEDIDRIEVVRGPSSALFGANAVTGVINIITKDTDRKEGAKVTVSTGTNKNNLHSIYYNDVVDRLSYSVGFEYSSKEAFDDKSYSHSYNKFESGRISPAAWYTAYQKNPGDYEYNPDFPPASGKSVDVYRLSSFFNFNVSDNTDLSLQYGRSFGKLKLAGTSGDLMLSNYEYVENNVLKLGYNWKNFNVSLTNVYGQIGEEYNFVGEFYGQQNGMNWNTIDIDAQNLFYIGSRNILMAGINIREVKSYSSAIYFKDRERKSQKFTAAFFNNEFSFNDNLKWILGGRYDKYDTPDKASFSPQSILFYEPFENNIFRLIYSEAIRAPFIADLYVNGHYAAGEYADFLGGGAAPIISILPNTDLNPMQIKSTELTYSTLLLENMNLDVSLYHYEVTDIIGYKAELGDSLVFDENGIYIGGTAIPLPNSSSAMDLRTVNTSGRLKSNGIELGLTYNLRPTWNVWGNYAFQNAKLQNNSLKSSPAHLAALGTNKRFNSGWNLSLSLNYVSSSELTVTNIMDHPLAMINDELDENPDNFFFEAITGTDPYKSKYIELGEEIYQALGGNVIDSGSATNWFNTLVFLGEMKVEEKDKLLELWTILTPAQASLFTAIKGIPLGINSEVEILFPDFTGQGDSLPVSLSDEEVAFATLRAVNGELYKISSTNESTEKSDDHIIANFRLSRNFFDNKAEFSISGSIRNSVRQYAFGEKTGNTFRTSFSYRF